MNIKEINLTTESLKNQICEYINSIGKARVWNPEIHVRDLVQMVERSMRDIKYDMFEQMVIKKMGKMAARLNEIQAELDIESTDIRLQVQETGEWAFRTGDSSYDLDHTGFWGASIIGKDPDEYETEAILETLTEEVLEMYAA